MEKLKLFSREQVGNAPLTGRQYSRPDSLSLVSRQSVLAFLLVLLTTVFGVGNAWGEDVTITFADLNLTNQKQYSDPFNIDANVTITFGGGANDGKYYDTGKGIRTYGGGTITIDAGSYTISEAAFTWDGSNKPGADNANPTGYSTSTGKWTGSASSIVLTRPSGSGHWRLQSVKVTYSTGGGSDPVAVESVSLDESAIELEVGEKQTLTATVLPNDATNKNVTWESDDTDVATVVSGLVTAIGEGTATITCKSVADNTKTATCTVTVSPAEVPTLTFDFSGQGYTNQQQYTSINADAKITISFGDGSNDGKYYDTGTAMRVYGGGHMTVAGGEGVTISKILLEFGSGDGSNAISTNVGSYDNAKWTGSAQSVTFNVGGTSGHRRIKVVKVFYVAAAIDVAMPTISGVTPFLSSTEVTLTQNDADAIYYTTDEAKKENPSVDTWTVYNSASKPSFNATTTIYAAAIKGSAWSAVAEKTFTKATVLTVAEAIAAIPNKNDFVDNQYVSGIVCTAGASVSSGKMTYYISDDGSETNRLQIYHGKNLNNTDFTAVSDLVIGDRVTVFGQLKNFNNTPEMNDGNYLVSKEGPAVAAPEFTPNGGGFMGETDVTITCETEGSAIYYTLDGTTTPTKSSTPYEAAIHLDATTTIKAIAYVGDDASLVITKTFTLTAPMTVADALTALDTEDPINNVAVAGIISTAPTSNPSSGKLTYYISDDGSATDQLEVFNGYGLNGASFSAKTDLQVGDEVTVFGNLTIFNSTTKEFASGSRLLAFNRPVVPSISADPVAVDAAAHAGQSVTITYENWGTVNVADAEATLGDNEACDEAFSGDWISNVDVAANFESVSFDIAANTGAARTAYMKIYALGDDATTEAEKVIAISQEAYVAPAEPASLPFAFDEGRADIATTQGMSQEGLDSDYGSSPKLKFNTTGDYVIINIASDPGKLTYDIKGNSFSDGTFKVQESADGETYTDVAEYTELGEVQSKEQTLLQATRFVKFIYTNKVNGNVALGNIAIAEYVAPAAVETPAFSPAGGEYAGAQSVTISCATVGATIYYTTDGTDPDNTSDEYTDAISVDESKTIKAIAYKGDDHSEIASATYTITPALTDYYEKVSSGAVAEGTYLIVYETGSLAFNGGAETLDASSNTIAVEITNDNKIGVTQATAAATFYIDPEAGTIQAANGKYIGQGSDANGMATSDNALVNTLSIDNGNAVIVSAGGAYLRYNATSGQERFRYFKSSSYTGQKAIQLYKLANEVIKPASGLAWDPAEDITLTVGDAFTAPELQNPNSIPANEITIASSNTDLATVTNGEVALVENATGSATITATYTGETYKPITVSYKIKVNPASSIVVSPSLYVNFASVEKDASLPTDKTITVTLNNVATATATLAGDDVFDIDKTALVAGENTITISVTSTENAGEFSATITIADDATENPAAQKVVNLSFTVNDPVTPEDPEVRKTWDLSIASYDANPTEEQVTWSATYVNMVADKANSTTAANNYLGGDTNNRTSSRFYKNSTLTITPNAKEITSVVFTATSEGYATVLGNSSWTNASASASGTTVTVTPTDGKNAIIAVVGGTCGFTAVQVNYKNIAPEPPVVDYTEVRNDLTEGWYYTMCLEKAVTDVRGGSIWKVISKSDNTTNPGIILEEVEMPLAAGRPYIFLAAASTLEVAYTGDAVDDPVNDDDNNGLIGSFTQQEIAQSDDHYIIYNNELYFVNSAKVYVGANRAYLNMAGVPAYSNEPVQGNAPRRRVTMAVHGEQVATGVDQVPSDQVPSTKVLINGQLFILRGEKMYDVTGKLVK